jgi:hypothetical protein
MVELEKESMMLGPTCLASVFVACSVLRDGAVIEEMRAVRGVADTSPSAIGLCLATAGAAAFALALLELIGIAQRFQYPDIEYDKSRPFGRLAARRARFSRGHWRVYVRYSVAVIIGLALITAGVLALME